MKRGQPLKRKTPLRNTKLMRRSAPMKRARISPRTPKPTDNPAHLAAVRTLPCAAAYLSTCGGRIEAHHQTHGRAKGTKAPDANTLPLCTRHHHEFHAAAGPFAPWNRDDRRAWQDAMVAQTQAALGATDVDAILR